MYTYIEMLTYWALLPIDPIVGNGSGTPHFLSPTTTGQNLF